MIGAFRLCEDAGQEDDQRDAVGSVVPEQGNAAHDGVCLRCLGKVGGAGNGQEVCREEEDDGGDEVCPGAAVACRFARVQVAVAMRATFGRCLERP